MSIHEYIDQVNIEEGDDLPTIFDLRSFDADHNGYLSRDEFRQAFKALDHDGDGVLSTSESEDMLKKHGLFATSIAKES